MNNIYKFLLATSITLSVFVLLVSSNRGMSFSGVTVGNEYNSTTTSPTFTVVPDFKVLKSGSGTLGSLIVTVAGSGGVINIYDATTTTNGNIYGTTTLAKLSTATAGTYVFDTNFSKGLLVETVGLNTGTTTITWR